MSLRFAAANPRLMLSVEPKQMPAISRAVASLRIFGDELIPEEITELLGCQPTEAWRRGDVQSVRAGAPFLRKRGAWFLRAPPTEPEDFNGQVAHLFAQTSNDLSVWENLRGKYQVDLFCGWFMSTSNDGVALSVAALRALADRGVELSLDVYDASEEGCDGPTSC